MQKYNLVVEETTEKFQLNKSSKKIFIEYTLCINDRDFFEFLTQKIEGAFMRIKEISIKETLKQHIVNNKREYIITEFIFVIGIFLGVLFVNNTDNNQKEQIGSYINEYITKMKDTNNINNGEVFKSSIKQNLLIAVGIWFLGTTVIGIPLVFGIVLYRGFLLGYTIATFVSTIGFSKGIIFIIISIVLQNLIFIPAILALAVSGFKLYKSIIKDKRKENIKLEIIRHTMFSIVMLILLIIAALIESFISTNILKIFIKYF